MRTHASVPTLAVFGSGNLKKSKTNLMFFLGLPFVADFGAFFLHCFAPWRHTETGFLYGRYALSGGFCHRAASSR